jgi:hypothetical protein
MNVSMNDIISDIDSACTHERFRVWLYKHYLLPADAYSRLTFESKCDIFSHFLRGGNMFISEDGHILSCFDYAPFQVRKLKVFSTYGRSLVGF